MWNDGGAGRDDPVRGQICIVLWRSIKCWLVCIWRAELESTEDARGRFWLYKEDLPPVRDLQQQVGIQGKGVRCLHPWEHPSSNSLFKKSNSFLKSPANCIQLLGTCSRQGPQGPSCQIQQAPFRPALLHLLSLQPVPWQETITLKLSHLSERSSSVSFCLFFLPSLNTGVSKILSSALSSLYIPSLRDLLHLCSFNDSHACRSSPELPQSRSEYSVLYCHSLVRPKSLQIGTFPCPQPASLLHPGCALRRASTQARGLMLSLSRPSFSPAKPRHQASGVTVHCEFPPLHPASWFINSDPHLFLPGL